jgi:hypothetical protein
VKSYEGFRAGVRYPHCDPFVLHAPGVCEFCDKHPAWQQERSVDRVNFTGQHDPDRAPCPSQTRRSLAAVERWPGNRPTKATP